MNYFLALIIVITSCSESFAQSKKTLYDFIVKSIDGEDFKMASLKGKKILIVNTASECGYTPQYEELETLYKKYQDKNFIIIGFPCNDFGAQEPGTNAEIKSFCKKNYGVTFPMMDKISTKGENIAPIYFWLCNSSENGVLDATVKWNFNKFLIDESGNVVKHLASSVSPLDKNISDWIESK